MRPQGRPDEAEPDRPDGPAAGGMAENDAVLVAAAVTGSQEAFRKLFDRYVRLVSVLIYQKIPRASDVEDLAQETFLRAWSGLPRLRNPRRFLPWLLRIARHLVADWHRAAARQPPMTERRLEGLPQEDDPGRRLESREEQDRLLHNLERLPERYRLALTMRFLEGITPQDIAQRLGEPSGTIRNRIFRGLQKLGKLIDENSEP